MPYINCRVRKETETLVALSLCFIFISFFFSYLMLPCCCTLFRSVYIFTCFDGRTMVVLPTVNNFVVHLNHIKWYSLLFCRSCCAFYSIPLHWSALQCSAVSVGTMYIVRNYIIYTMYLLYHWRNRNCVSSRLYLFLHTVRLFIEVSFSLLFILFRFAYDACGESMYIVCKCW